MRTEYLRQAWHVCFGTAFIVLLPYLGTFNLLLLAIGTFAVGSFLAFLILHGIRIPFLYGTVSGVQRGHERHLPGRAALSLNLGVLLLLVLFTRADVVLGALVVLTYGDAAATVIGRRFGKHKFHKKLDRTVEGTLAGVAVSAAFLAIFFAPQVALAVAVAGMLAEHIPMNDSYSIPVVSAVVLTLIL